MRLTKIYLVIGLVILSTFFASNVLAENEKPESETNRVTLAQVNLQDAKIISQKENTLEISFNLNNREGAQSGVKYGVKLIETVDGKQVTAEEYVYPEVLSLAVNTTTEKIISFTPSFNIKGEYEVVVSARNYSGLPLGTSNLGKITFTEQPKTVEIVSETCSTSIERANKNMVDKNTQTIFVSNGDKIFLNCIIKNHLKEQISVTPQYETYIKTPYGEKIVGLPESKEVISLRPLEEKNFVFAIPRNDLPQAYLVKTSVGNTKLQSNSIQTPYVISGLSATIKNVSLDKNSYKANETAKIAFFWTSSATNREELTSISLKADIVNKNKRSCIESPINTQMAGVGFIEIPVTISKSCDDPEVTISLHDALGKTLDQKALIFEANEKTNLFIGKTGIIIIIVIIILALIGLAFYLKNLKKKDEHKDDDNLPKSGHIEGAMLAIFFVLSVLLVPGGEVKADTTYLGEVFAECWTDGSIYSPNSSVVVQCQYSVGYGSYSAGAGAQISGQPTYVSSPPSHVPQYYEDSYPVLVGTLTAPSASGNYYVVVSLYVTNLENPYDSGNVYYADLQLPFTVSAPVSATVDVKANDQDYLTITSGTRVGITWNSYNSTSCSCSPSCGNSWGSYPSTPFFGGDVYPTSTTTYTVSCDPW